MIFNIGISDNLSRAGELNVTKTSILDPGMMIFLN